MKKLNLLRWMMIVAVAVMMTACGGDPGGTNHAPVATAQSVTTDEDIAKAIALSGTDEDNDTLGYIIATNPAHGTLVGTAPNLTYTPSANWHGSDSFTFKVNDGTVDSAAAKVSITVNSVNDAPPVAAPQSLHTDEDVPLAIELTGSDVDGDSMTFTVTHNPEHGTLSGTAPNLTYTPDANYNGADEFKFKINDGTADSGEAIVTIDVQERPFQLMVMPANPGSSNDDQFTIPTHPDGGYLYDIDCDDDGIYEITGQTGDYTCTFALGGIRRISIKGIFPQIYFAGAGDKSKLAGVFQWGTQKWRSMFRAFEGCDYFSGTINDTPNLSGVSSVVLMFRNASAFNQPIGNWNMSSVTDMQSMFRGASSFNQNINDWDVSNVENMQSLFESADSFNKPLDKWNVSKVTNMESLFASAADFDQDISNWDTAKVTNMNGTFAYATSFNQNLSGWNTSNVEEMDEMFLDASAFTGHDLSGWNVDKVTQHLDFLTGTGAGNTPPDWP